MGVLQGRLSLSVGHEALHSEAGAFTVLGKDALSADKMFLPDYTATVSTPHVRLLTISKSKFVEALELGKDPLQLEQALDTLRAELAGETSRMEARERRDRQMSPFSLYSPSETMATVAFSNSPCFSPAIDGYGRTSPKLMLPTRPEPKRKKTQDSL